MPLQENLTVPNNVGLKKLMRKKTFTIDELSELSHAIIDKIGNFNTDNITVHITLNEEALNKLNRDFYYLANPEGGTIENVDEVDANISGINYSFRKESSSEENSSSL